MDNLISASKMSGTAPLRPLSFVMFKTVNPVRFLNENGRYLIVSISIFHQIFLWHHLCRQLPCDWIDENEDLPCEVIVLKRECVGLIVDTSHSVTTAAHRQCPSVDPSRSCCDQDPLILQSVYVVLLFLNKKFVWKMKMEKWPPPVVS